MNSDLIGNTAVLDQIEEGNFFQVRYSCGKQCFFFQLGN